MDHWYNFLEFSKLELASGGPDHHLQLAVHGMNMVDDIAEKAWRAGCYVGPYEISTGAIIWENWPLERVVNHPDHFAAWIEDTWQYWQLRRERRAARTVKKMTESMLSYVPFCLIAKGIYDFDYEFLWEHLNDYLRYFGRYSIIKILETLNRGGVIQAKIPDIRPIGAWSPRLTLSWLYPEEDKDSDNWLIPKGNKLNNIGAITRAVDATKAALERYIGKEVSYFQIEVLLCNYRQVLDERNGRYAGWSLDMDLEHRINSEKWQSSDFPFYKARKQYFPKEHLGEINGWSAPRKELCGYKGYFWSDLIYDYHNTKNFREPVKRA